MRLSDRLGGQRGGDLKVRLRWKEAVLVASALRKVQLERKGEGGGDKNRVGDGADLVFRGAGDRDSHLMSLTTSWWDMLDTSEPFTWRERERSGSSAGRKNKKRRPAGERGSPL